MGNNHALWFDKSKRKVLVISFEDYYQKKIAKTVSKIDITVNDSIGFTTDEIYYKDLELKMWYLTTKNKHLWKHHYLGTQGIIMIFSFSQKQDEKIIFEAMNVFCDINIVSIPILVLIDTNNKDEMIVEKLRTEMNKNAKISNDIRFQQVNFEDNIGEVQSGFDWLCETMKPLA